MIILMELLKVLRSLTDHHPSVRVVAATAAFGLVGQRHVLVILFCKGGVGVVTRRLHKLVLGIQYVNILEILAGLLQ